MTPLYPGPAYRICTPRLVIRCWEPTDASHLKAAVDENIEYLKPWLFWAYQEPTSLKQRIDWLRRARGRFDMDNDYGYGIFDSSEQRVLGGTGLHTRLGETAREIGYWIHKDYANQGLATEAAASLTRVAFEVDGVHRVEIHCDPNNHASAAVPRKLGFSLEATLGERLQKPDGSWRDTMIWTLFVKDYPDSICSKAEISAYDAANRQIV